MYILKYIFICTILVIKKECYTVYNLSKFNSSLHICKGSFTLLHMVQFTQVAVGNIYSSTFLMFLIFCYCQQDRLIILVLTVTVTVVVMQESLTFSTCPGVELVYKVCQHSTLRNQQSGCAVLLPLAVMLQISLQICSLSNVQYGLPRWFSDEESCKRREMQEMWV